MECRPMVRPAADTVRNRMPGGSVRADQISAMILPWSGDEAPGLAAQAVENRMPIPVSRTEVR